MMGHSTEDASMDLGPVIRIFERVPAAVPQPAAPGPASAPTGPAHNGMPPPCERDDGTHRRLDRRT